jgi:hypothetical protein
VHDTVGIFLKVNAANSSRFRSLGPQVQTLTKAMTSILCKGLEGITPQEVLDVPADFVPKIVGADLVRQRSQTVYHILTRMKSAAKVWLNRHALSVGALFETLVEIASRHFDLFSKLSSGHQSTPRSSRQWCAPSDRPWPQ